MKLGGAVTSLTASQLTGIETTTSVPKTPPSTMIVATPQYQVPACMRPDQRQGGLKAQATTRGPNHSTFTILTDSMHSKGPWFFSMSVATPGHRAQSLGGGCWPHGHPSNGTTGMTEEWPCNPGPHDRGVAGSNYFLLAAEVPQGVRSVKLMAGSRAIRVPVSNRWFIAISKSPISMPVTVVFWGPIQGV
jgi:hypothetical protein